MTLFTSADKRTIKGYAGFAVLCAVFSFVYEMFSHQVYSIYMIGLAAFPILFGIVPVLFRKAFSMHEPGQVSRMLNFWAVMTLTAGSCLTGVFDIYGTTSDYTKLYWIAGAFLAGLSVIRYEIESPETKNLLPAPGGSDPETGNHNIDIYEFTGLGSLPGEF